VEGRYKHLLDYRWAGQQADLQPPSPIHPPPNPTVNGHVCVGQERRVIRAQGQLHLACLAGGCGAAPKHAPGVGEGIVSQDNGPAAVGHLRVQGER
jgi:hypothetical protein